MWCRQGSQRLPSQRCDRPLDPVACLGLGLLLASLPIGWRLLRSGRGVAAFGLAWIWIAFLPTSGLIPGAATLQVAEPGGDQLQSEPFPITISGTPGKPVITGASRSVGGALGSSIQPGGELTIWAQGIDSSGAVVTFTWGSDPVESATVTAVGASIPGQPLRGVGATVTAPSGPGEQQAVSVSIHTRVNGVDSPESDPIVLIVPIQ